MTSPKLYDEKYYDKRFEREQGNVNFTTEQRMTSIDSFLVKNPQIQPQELTFFAKNVQKEYNLINIRSPKTADNLIFSKSIEPD